MKIERPQFELTRVYAQGTKESPEIIFVSRMVWDTRMARRGFLGLGIGIASVLLSGCDKQFNGILVAHSGPVNALAISPDGKTLVSGSSDNTIKLWSLPDGKLLATLEGHKDRVKALAISPDGKTLASGNFGRMVKLWNLEKPSPLVALSDPSIPPPTPYHPPAVPSGGGAFSGGGRSGRQPCGAPIPPGATCTCNCVPVRSDRNAKEAFETTNPLLILQRLSELPIQTWNYKWDDAAIRHIGPMAQDFAAAFAVGEDDKHICPVDAQGVAFAAIQGLYRIVKEKDAQTESLQEQLQKKQEENQELKARIEALERLIKPLV